ncbi:MAG: hypothetical protein SFW64_04490 [Alphaproteobacteria bacterium]|nr:hypothetical protein [Alphaproteobacteria bacterium]
MVSTVSAYDFSAVLDGLLARREIRGPHATMIASVTRERALALLCLPDVRYMPAFKILDMLTAMVAIAAAIAEATQLRVGEVRALLRESLGDDTKLIRHFMLEAALERARYEPLMMDARTADAQLRREIILQRRWAAMRTAHQEKAALPEAWMDSVEAAVACALAADDFRRFRQGPLLQMFAEMLALARKMHQQGEPLAALAAALAQGGTLWRRYALKTARYREPSAPVADIRALRPPHTIH